MPNPMSEWKASRNAALKAWRESLPQETRAEMDAAWDAAKVRGRARRQARQSKDRMIVSMSFQGFSIEEIAQKFGVEASGIRRRCSELGVKGRMGGGARRLAETWIKTETHAAIAALATERGVSAPALVERVLAHAFEDGAAKARGLLRYAVFRVVEGRAA